MSEPIVQLYKLTRKEFREALERGEFQTAIVPTGSTEQHDEHLAMIHDTASAEYIAVQAARQLYPQVVVSTPVAVGVSEHWMEFKGTLTLRREVFQEVVLDLCDSLRRHGVRRVLILNGHAGNIGPLTERLEEFRQRLGIPLEFRSHWDFVPPDLAAATIVTERIPGHASEYETSIAWAAFPQDVRPGDMVNPSSQAASREKGETLIRAEVQGVVALLQEMIG
jgi:creatinine amidohydrolase